MSGQEAAACTSGLADAASAATSDCTQSMEEPRCRRPRRSGAAKKSELPSTLQKSPAKAQRTFAKVHDAAAEQYGEGERAHRVAYDALKHSFEKVGDHWEPKAQKGPSDSRARSGGPNPTGRSAEGVDANASKKHLDGSRAAAGYLGSIDDEQGRVGLGDQEGQPARDGPQSLALIASPGARRNSPAASVLQQCPPRAASACGPCGG